MMTTCSVQDPTLNQRQRAFDHWVESADPIATAPLRTMVESLKSLASTLRSVGMREDNIRAEVEEMVRASCASMRAKDQAFIVCGVRKALDEVLGNRINQVK